MTTATPLGGTTFFSLNVTTREDFLYKSKANVAWQLGEGWQDEDMVSSWYRGQERGVWIDCLGPSLTCSICPL